MCNHGGYPTLFFVNMTMRTGKCGIGIWDLDESNFSIWLNVAKQGPARCWQPARMPAIPGSGPPSAVIPGPGIAAILAAASILLALLSIMNILNYSETLILSRFNLS